MKLILCNKYFTFNSKLILFWCFLKNLVKYLVKYSFSNHFVILFLIKILFANLCILNYREKIFFIFIYKIYKFLLFFIFLNFFKLKILNLVYKQWCLFWNFLIWKIILFLSMIYFNSFLSTINSFDLKSALVLDFLFFFIIS